MSLEAKPPTLPYAAPAYPASLHGLWRVGNHLEVAPDATFPERCIKCNLPSDGDAIEVEVSWVDPSVREKYRPIGFLPYVRLIRAVDEQRNIKIAKVRVRMCVRHKRRRRFGHYIQIATLPIAIISILVGLVLALGRLKVLAIALVALALIMFGVCIVVTLVWCEPPVEAVWMKNGIVTLKGICLEFLDSIPVGSRPAPTSAKDVAAAAQLLSDRLRSARRPPTKP